MSFKRSRKRIGCKSAITLLSAGLVALCSNLSHADISAQTNSSGRIKVCAGSRGIFLSAKTNQATVKRVLAAAKRRSLTVPIHSSGQGRNSNLSCPVNGKARAKTKILKIGNLGGNTLEDVLSALIKALLTPPSSKPTLSDGQLEGQPPSAGTPVGSSSGSEPILVSDATEILNSVSGSNSTIGLRAAALERTNFVFVRDSVRGVENRFIGEDPNGQTIFNLRIPDPVKQPWARLVSDFESQMSLDARFVQSPGSGVQLNEFVWQRSTDGTLLVIHAPDNATMILPDRDQFEILLSYGDTYNPYRVIRLPLSKLQDSSYNFLGGTGPWGPLRLGRDASGQQYYGRSIMGLNGMPLGVLEFPDLGANGSGSKVIFKPAVSNSWYYEQGFPTLSSIGMVFRRRGVGYMEAASIVMPNPNFRNMYGPIYAGDGVVDNITSLLRGQVKLSSDVNATSATLNQRMPWRSIRSFGMNVPSSFLGMLTVTDVDNY